MTETLFGDMQHAEAKFFAQQGPGDAASTPDPSSRNLDTPPSVSKA